MDYVAVYLEIISENEASVHCNFKLVHQDTGRSLSVSSPQMVFNEKFTYWGLPEFMKKSDLVARGYLKDDCLEIECDLTVIKVGEIDVPPPDLLRNLGDLLESQVGVDVTFNVKEEAFHAHRIVLAARSPVLMAQLYGPLDDKRKRSVVVEDMAPRVFKTLRMLHFVYKDCLPAMDDLDGSEYEEMGKHLLVAADRYGMERMKLMCESILCNRLSVETVAATLVLADQHHCGKLKDACIRFIESSNRMDNVAASQGYENLKRACPVLTAELWEKSAKSRKL
ncbi:BTB/POZ and MATH domain-containing protein 1-like [Panicum virgatum]|nr:BTB/POZ and MATH domain-containing protein 1-like [Panicum virgatum]